MLEFLVDNIFVVFWGKVFQQIVDFPMGTNYAPLLADIFLYSYEAEFIQSLLSTGKKKLPSQFNFTYRYIDDVLSINNPDFENYLGQMYPPELEIKHTTEPAENIEVMVQEDIISLRYTMIPSTVFCRSSIYNQVFIISVRNCIPSLWKHYMSRTNLHWPYILLMLDLLSIDFKVLFGHFLKQAIVQRSCYEVQWNCF